MLQRTQQLPGTFPVTQAPKAGTRKEALWHRSSSNNNSTATVSLKTKVKSYFRPKEQVVVKEKRSSWKNIWKSRSTKQDFDKSNAVGTVLSVSVPITISNTTHYYDSTDKKLVSSSIVQQLIILQPMQVYSILFVIVLSLLVLAFAILEVHRTISILQSVIDGVKFLLVGVTAKSMMLFSFLKSYCF
jgi:hypothetical protein